MTFIQAVRAGLKHPHDHNSWIEDWHVNGPHDVSLEQHLGLTPEQMNRYLLNPLVLCEIVGAIECDRNWCDDFQPFAVAGMVVETECKASYLVGHIHSEGGGCGCCNDMSDKIIRCYRYVWFDKE